MGRASIPVDLVNPGQVFAALGLLEAAEELCGPASGGFAWQDGPPRFEVDAAGADDPLAHVLEFLAGAEVTQLAPRGWTPEKKTKKKGKPADDWPIPMLELSDDSTGPKPSEMALPIILGGGNRPRIRLGHWADGSSRDSFKLYSGNRSACDIARAMLIGKKKGKQQDSQGIRQLWDERRAELISDPFGTLCPMGGSFNFDARCAWTPIGSGYSPDKHEQKVLGSPVVELLAAWGLENARPQQVEGREYRYSVWRGRLPPMLARPAFAGDLDSIDRRQFRLRLGLSGKNKIVAFAQEEI